MNRNEKGLALVLLISSAVVLLFAGCASSGTTATGASEPQWGGSGWSIAVSADGTWLIAGNPSKGTAEVHLRQGQKWELWTVLTLDKGEPGDRFGASVAISGDGSTIIVGAPKAASGGEREAGVIYLFEMPKEGWPKGTYTQTAGKLEAFNDASAGSHFGMSVAASHDARIILVGAPGAADRRGRAHVFLRGKAGQVSATTWTTLGYHDPAPGDEFGASAAISLDGRVIALGAPGRNKAAGTTFVFSMPEKGWSDSQSIMMFPIEFPGPQTGDRFGESVALSKDGSRLAAGAPGREGDGSVFSILVDWKTTKFDTNYVALKPNSGLTRFGLSLAISTDGAVIAAGASTGGKTSGAVQVMWSDNGSWTGSHDTFVVDRKDWPEAMLGHGVAMTGDGTLIAAGAPLANAGEGDFAFAAVKRDKARAAEAALYAPRITEMGWAVCVSKDGKTLAVSRPRAAGAVPETGDVGVLEKQGDGSWKVLAILTASDGAAGDRFGESLAISGDGSTIAIGASQADSGGSTEQGAVYLFVRPKDGWKDTNSFTARLTIKEARAGDLFGSGLDLSADGSVLVAGAPGRSGNTGDAYLLMRPSGGWKSDVADALRSLVLKDMKLNEGDRFGTSVAISDDGSMVAVSAPKARTTGRLYCYFRPPTGWQQLTRLGRVELPGQGESLDGAVSNLGKSIALTSSGSVMACSGDTAEAQTEFLYIVRFSKQGGGRVNFKMFANRITTKYPFEMIDFGRSLSISSDGSLLAIGSIGDDRFGFVEIHEFEKPDLQGDSSFKVLRDTGCGTLLGRGLSLLGDGSLLFYGSPHKEGGAGDWWFLKTQ